jgi:8-oxo-dGTP pyrophosphatase MutT (NUDIX family)
VLFLQIAGKSLRSDASIVTRTLQNRYKPRKGTGKDRTRAVKKDRIKFMAPRPATQHAALCFRRTSAGEPEILLITSRDTGRWVLPKGWPKKGEEGGSSALREAHEEAGVVGTLLQDGIGLYFYDKTMPSSSPVPCCVAVHAVKVAYLAYRFPEMGLRRQEWFSPQAAAAAVDEPELKVLLENFVPGQIHDRNGKKG